MWCSNHDAPALSRQGNRLAKTCSHRICASYSVGGLKMTCHGRETRAHGYQTLLSFSASGLASNVGVGEATHSPACDAVASSQGALILSLMRGGSRGHPQPMQVSPKWTSPCLKRIDARAWRGRRVSTLRITLPIFPPCKPHPPCPIP